MSSEGSETLSSGSRIRQFGLYRTIDARTEEFLRLSRKRQIKQGCACAAVSTAITVTVVISVLLVYEYSINAGSNSSKILTLKSNWYGLLNETTDGTALDTKFAQKKINFDSTTLKLLPVLLKALNQNRYLEKILDDYSSSSPSYEKNKESTEFRFKKNIVVNERWAKMPTSRLFTLEYKTAPLIYYKNPTTNSDYFTKIRKIRDYQRMLNYFDKMINEKVKFASTLPIADVKDKTTSEKPYIKSRPIEIRNNKKLSMNKSHISKTIKTKDNKDQTDCKCSKNRGDLLQKVISNMKLIMHDIEKNKSPCGNSKKQESLHFNPLDKEIKDSFPNNITDEWTITSAKPEIASKTKTHLHTENKINISKHINNNKISSFYRIPIKAKPFETNMVEYPSKTNNNILKQFHNEHPLHRLNIKNDNEITTIKTTISATTIINDLNDVNNTRMSNKSEDKKFIVKSFIDSWLQSNAPKLKNKIHEPVPVFSSIEYDDYFSSTPKTNNGKDFDFDNLDVHSMELIKSKSVFVRNNNTDQSNVEINPPKTTVDYDISEKKNSSLYFIDKMVTVIFPTLQTKIQNNTFFDQLMPAENSKNIDETKTNNIHNQLITTLMENEMSEEVRDENIILRVESIKNLKNVTIHFHNITNLNDTTKPEEKNATKIPDDTLKVITFNSWKNAKTNFQEKVKTNTDYKTSNIDYQHTSTPKYIIDKNVLEEELPGVKMSTQTLLLNKITSGNDKPKNLHYPQETNIPEEEIDKIIPDEELQEAETTKQIFVSNKTISGIENFKNLHDILKTTGESKKYTSMLPINRPVYLEINRNDWRHDDHQDFDTNINNNNFDFSNLLK